MSGSEDILLSSNKLIYLFTPIFGIFCAMLYLLYYIYFVPMNWKRGLDDVSYNIAIGRIRNKYKKSAIVNNIRRLRKIGDHNLIPPPYPNGWYSLIESKDVKPGQVVEVTALGEHFAVFRTESNKVRVFNAYCPHMGANLAIGGQVLGDSIQCPFHEWRFNGQDGECVNVPYSSCGKGPSGVKLKKWISAVANGSIFVWYHSEGDDPWKLPRITEIENNGFVYLGRNEFTVNCHIQEIPENGADLAHFPALHGEILLGGNEPKGKSLSLLGTHSWEATWQPEPTEKHMAVVTLKHVLTLNIKPFRKFKFGEMNVKGYQIGPAIVHLHLYGSGRNFVIVQTVTPVEPMIQKVIHQFYGPRNSGWFSKFLVVAESIMFERDMNVWNHKSFAHSPCLVKEEKPIKNYRTWFSQFYSENSRTFAQAKETLDW